MNTRLLAHTGMVHALISILFNAGILFVLATLFPYNASQDTGIVIASNTWQLYLVWGIVLGLLNLVVKPILKAIGFPFLILSLGLFIFVINAIILYLLQNILAAINVAGVSFEIKGVGVLLLSALLLTVFNTIYNAFVKKLV